MTIAPPPSPELVELRRYRLHPGRRDELVTLFEREFIETQEAVGLQVLGQFRDLDDAERFTWLRGFAGMAERLAGLQAFYGGPHWAAHRDAANATMLDSDDVFLLRPAWPGAGLPPRGEHPPQGAPDDAPGLLAVLLFHLEAPASAPLLAAARGPMDAALRESDARFTAWYLPAPERNDFPRLPVRENESMLVGFAMFDDEVAHARCLAGAPWQRTLRALPPEVLRVVAHRLAPTARSALKLSS
jgi:hypothetical protein